MKAWAEMTARERDALVAEKVMGWQWWSHNTARFYDSAELMRVYRLCSPKQIEHSNRLGDFGQKQGKEPGAIEVPPYDLLAYTTCPKACADVIEAMRAKGWNAMMNRRVTGWYGEFYRPEPDRLDRGEAYADAMAEAVALAALRACGVDI